MKTLRDRIAEEVNKFFAENGLPYNTRDSQRIADRLASKWEELNELER